jgi:sulfite reductase (NADPH) flavoprotein alpha-component
MHRLYSIASSIDAHPEQVDLTVGVVAWESHGRPRGGVCSSYLGLRRQPGDEIGVFVHEGKNFRLPEDGSTDIIMVGPGTGIAPFRAFLEQRIQDRAAGRNWLFFGDQHEATDYLYREQFEAWKADGKLDRIDLAFSRDQAEKVYVQHRMAEQAAELWAWLDGGAHFYVCGDALRMAKDVDAMLHTIAQEQGGMDEDAAKAWIKDLKKAKRYQRDVYAV